MSNDFLTDDSFSGDDRSNEPKKKGGGLLKILLVIAGLGVLGVCGCCGALFYSFTPNTIASTPAETQVVLDEVLPGLNLPDDLQPQTAFELNALYFIPVKVVVAAKGPIDDAQPTAADMFTIAQLGGMFAENAELRDMSLQNAQQGAGNGAVIKRETGEVLVQGKPVAVVVNTVRTEKNGDVKQAMLSLSTDNGPVMVILMRPVDTFSMEELQRIVGDVEATPAAVAPAGQPPAVEEVEEVVEDAEPVETEKPVLEIELDEPAVVE